MRIERFAIDAPAREIAARARSLAPSAASVGGDVRRIVDDVEARGDIAVDEYTRRFDAPDPPPLSVAPLELAEAAASLDADLRVGLDVAIANVAEIAVADVGHDKDVALPEGHQIRLREIPVRRAGIYVPGGRAPYPSTAVMGIVTARAAGVDEIVVCTPPPADPVLLGACAACGALEVYRVGGAQAIAALAHGTETIRPVDVIVGPGNLYVQEAKRLVSDRVGIDGFAGPSDLLVVFDAADDGSIRLIGLDLLAQAEHGPATLVLATAADPVLLDRLAAELDQLAPLRPSADPAACVLLDAPSLDAALEFVDAYAPEHLQLIGPGAEALAPRVRCAGCVFVGWPAATAFGDYVAGSNHILPTAGAARFASGLSPRHFRRRMAEVRIAPEAVEPLARAGAPIARAEGFTVHAEAMTARAPRLRDNPGS